MASEQYRQMMKTAANPISTTAYSECHDKFKVFNRTRLIMNGFDSSPTIIPSGGLVSFRSMQRESKKGGTDGIRRAIFVHNGCWSTNQRKKVVESHQSVVSSVDLSQDRIIHKISHSVLNFCSFQPGRIKKLVTAIISSIK